jgi:voltage-gated sodium channel
MNTTTNSPRPGLRAAVRNWVESPRIQNCIMGLIVINAIVLGLETVPSVMQDYGVILLATDSVILAGYRQAGL